MRRLRLLLLTTASLVLAAGCSAGAEEPSSPSSASELSSSSSSSPSTSDGTSSSTSPAAQVLRASVGTQGDPGAFEIALADADGKPVTTVPAGRYTVEVQDYSKIHDFHLTGAGVEETTSVAGTGATTWQVDLVRGEYDYVCDPHAGTMKGALTVT